MHYFSWYNVEVESHFQALTVIISSIKTYLDAC